MKDPHPDYGRRLAREAIQSGLSALEQKSLSEALRFFDRARRLAPNDPASLLLAASATSGADPARAIELLDRLITQVPTHRDAHVTRAILLHKIGMSEAAAEALHHTLSNFAVPFGSTFDHAADRIAQDAGCAGWAGIAGSGRAKFQAANFRAAFDGKRLVCTGDRPAECELPKSWRGAAELVVTSRAGRVLGSPVDLAKIRRATGFVEFVDGVGLRGWALAPFDPDTAPVINIYANNNRTAAATVLADDGSLVMDQGDGAQQALGFTVPLARLPLAAIWHVRTQDGAALFGSPVSAGLEAQAARDHRSDLWRPVPVSFARILPHRHRKIPARRPVNIVVPLYRDAALAASCIASVRASCPSHARIVVVDDGSPDPELRQWAEQAAASGKIVLLRHDTNRGFPAAVNTGLGHAPGCDVVLLNSDTCLPPGALQRLADAAYSAADIGTVTPMTNDGTITTLGTPGISDPMPDEAALAAIDATLSRANPGLRVDLPTCVGFCTFIRHDCLAETGLFREDAFAQGYGEENDFSCRAALLGWRHVAACDVAVAHAGGASFGAVRLALMKRNLGIMERLHPGYLAMVTAFAARDPLQVARHEFDRALWAAGCRISGAIILVTHDSGGGVERHVSDRAASVIASGKRAIVVRPATGTASDTATGYLVSDGTARTHPNLVFPDVPSLAAFLRDDGPRGVELHHTASHVPGIERLAGLLRVPFDIVVHDYAAICPRVTLCGGTGAYCGLPTDPRDCDDCIADNGARIPFSGSVGELRATQAILFGAARRVIVPAEDVAARLRRIMPRLQPTVGAWEADLPAGATLPAPAIRVAGEGAHIALAGAIGQDKGYDILLACARDAARRSLPLRFTLVGHTPDDERLLRTGRVFITGPFAEGEAPSLLREAGAGIAFLPSVWPETWCYALSALWEAGLTVLAFDLGAQAERIRARHGGELVPLGLPASALNDCLMRLASDTTNHPRVGNPPSHARVKPLLPTTGKPLQKKRRAARSPLPGADPLWPTH